ncbi:MAG: peptidyl-prolyl cis-trans isomerase [bacterium]
MNLRYKEVFRNFIRISLILCVFILVGCVPELKDDTPLAMVNGEPVTYGEFKDELKGIHLRRNEKKGIGPINIESFLEKLIRRRLFIQEGIRTGFHKDPDVKKALDTELKRQAVLLLHREAIDNKIEVSDDEAWEKYCSNLNMHQDEVEDIKKGLSMDPNDRSVKIQEYITGLRKNAVLERDPNFDWHGNASCDPNQIVARVNGKGVTYNDLTLALNESGQEKDWRSALDWLIDRELLAQQNERFVPDRDSFEKTKERLKKDLKKEERKKREVEYLKELRNKASISKEIIDPDILLSEEEDPNSPVAYINGAPVTLSDLRSNIRLEDLKAASSEDKKDIIDKRLQYVIDCRLIDQEALSKGFGERPEVKKAIEAAEDDIIYKKFFREILIPSIRIDDNEVESYYKKHEDLFLTPIYVKIDEIRLENQEQANQIRTELQAGADFAFLTKVSLPQRITSYHWLPINKIPEVITEGIRQSEEGDWFGPVSWERGYSIFLLKRRRGGERIPFGMAKKDVKKRLWDERYDQAIKKWENVLRSSSDIILYEDRFKAILSGVGALVNDNITNDSE